MLRLDLCDYADAYILVSVQLRLLLMRLQIILDIKKIDH